MKEKMICTCPVCKTQFFENKIKITKWDEIIESVLGENNIYEEGYLFLWKGRSVAFHCSVCKKITYLHDISKCVEKKKDINYKPIKKSWWRFCK